MEANRSAGVKRIRAWFKRHKWKPFPYQEEAWTAYAAGASGLISVPTGYGKTLGATLGPIAEAIDDPPRGMFLLYISPLKALTRDLSQSLQKVLDELETGLKIEVRTGDTSGSAKARQLKKPPPILFTTPESLSFLLSYPGAEKMFGNLRAVVVDEWHELIAGKRGVQTQLGLSRLRGLNPALRVWGLSATLGNLEEAAETLAGPDAVLVRAHLPKEIELDPVYPDKIDSFPWAGHLGLRLLPKLVEKLSFDRSTLIFTNTRSQVERWHEALHEHFPEHRDQIAIHHSAIDRDDREAVEEGLRTGDIKWVVCTSSLDLGVDFQKVEQVVQIGSAKSLARLVQRAGRSRHRPGEPSHLVYLPTNSWELVELEAARHALDRGVIEPRRSMRKPIDVLVQHLVTLACGDGFRENMLSEIRLAYAYRDLTEDEWRWAIQFIRSGGSTLRAYPQYQKVFQDEEGVFRIRNTMMARQHRMSIGTITSSQQLSLVMGNRRRIGTIEESFISKLKRGDAFYFSGRRLEFLFLKDMKAYVRPSKVKTAVTPAWAGTQLPLSESLSQFFQSEIARDPSPAIKPLLDAQERLSHRPLAGELLIEQWDARDGRYLYIYPFGGRAVHEGLAALWTYRLGVKQKGSFSFSVNDYGLQIVGPKLFPFYELITPDFFSTEHLEEQILRTVNMTEMALRQFRGIAQTAGLVFSGYPSARKTGKQIQVSSSLLFEVFRKHDPESLLFQQAQRSFAAAAGDRSSAPHFRALAEVAASVDGDAAAIASGAADLGRDECRALNHRDAGRTHGAHEAGVGAMDLSWNGQDFALLPDRALLWRNARTLILSDIHLGKAEEFQAAGIPVPSSVHDEDLRRLRALLEEHSPERVFILGDFVHSNRFDHPELAAAFRALRSRERWILSLGNHDVRGQAKLAAWGFDEVTGDIREAGLVFCHDESSCEGPSVNGHVHPVIRFGRGADRMRLPCFVVGPRRLLLPSFGTFTGGYEITPRKDERIFVSIGESMAELPRHIAP